MLERLNLLIAICQRFNRPYDANAAELLRRLTAWQSEPGGLEKFAAIWDALTAAVATTPQWLDLLFPEECAAAPEILEHARQWRNQQYLPGAETGGVPDSAAGVTDRLLMELSTGDPAAGDPFRFLSRFYCFKDLLYGYFVAPEMKPVQHAIFQQCYLQRHHWSRGYAGDYPYQGMAQLGISGVKPSEERLARYAVDDLLGPNDRVLDIGANTGMLALAIAPSVGSVTGVEINPFLVNIGRIGSAWLGIDNASFEVGDFVEFWPEEPFDAIFSLANHCTIDGNLSMNFEEYVAKVFALLRPGGYLFFESHNVFGPGAGGAGDDGDLNAKFDIVERYFEVVRYRMTETYVPAFDIDKLFVVLRRRPAYDPSARRTFCLEEAIQRYAY